MPFSPPLTVVPAESTQTPVGEALGSFARMDAVEAELRTLQQQALATQNSLQGMQVRVSGDESAAGSAPEYLPIGLVVVAVMIAALAWRYSTQWRPLGVGKRTTRPKIQAPLSPRSLNVSRTGVDPGDSVFWNPEDHVLAEPASPPATTAPQAVQPDPRDSPDMPAAEALADAALDALPALDTTSAFSSAAAATDVMRVRNSLVEKRTRRARLHEMNATGHRESMLELPVESVADGGLAPPVAPSFDAAPILPSESVELEPVDRFNAFFDADPTAPLPADADADANSNANANANANANEPVAPQPPVAIPTPDLDGGGLSLDSEATADAPVDVDVDVDDDVGMPVHSSAAMALELARESLALGLWREARELVHEALEGGDVALESQRQTLLSRIKTHEDRSIVAVRPWVEARKRDRPKVASNTVR